MGTWSAQPFGNDTAADWAYDLEGASDWGVVSAALRVAADASATELEADGAAVAIAAAEVVARGLGRAETPVASEDVDAFVGRAPLPPAEVVSLAVAALDVATSAQGELAELWEEDPDWLAENERLRTALTTA